jgi:hypothetical protein
MEKHRAPRYKMPKRIEAVIQGDSVLVTLECGHSYTQKPYWDSTQLESFLALQQEQIGSRQRCRECEKQCIHESTLVALGLTDIEDPAVQARLLALSEQMNQADQQAAAFYNLMAEAQ